MVICIPSFLLDQWLSSANIYQAPSTLSSPPEGRLYQDREVVAACSSQTQRSTLLLTFFQRNIAQTTAYDAGGLCNSRVTISIALIRFPSLCGQI